MSMSDNLSFLQGMTVDYSNPTGFGLPHYANSRKSQKRNKSLSNGVKPEEKTEPEEPVDTSKLEIKFVDQTWDMKKVSTVTCFTALKVAACSAGTTGCACLNCPALSRLLQSTG